MAEIKSLFKADGSSAVLYLVDDKVFSWEELQKYNNFNNLDLKKVKTLKFYREYEGKKDVIGFFDDDGDAFYVHLINSKKTEVFNAKGNSSSWEQREQSMLSLYAEFIKRGNPISEFSEPEMILTESVGSEEFKIEFFRLFDGFFDVIRVDDKYYKPFTDGYYMVADDKIRNEKGNLVWNSKCSDSIFRDLMSWCCKFNAKGIEFIDCNVRNFLGEKSIGTVAVTDYFAMGIPKNENPFPKYRRADKTLYEMDGKYFSNWLSFMSYCVRVEKWPTEGRKLEYFRRYEGKRDVIKESKPVTGRDFTLYSSADDKSFNMCDSRRSIYCGEIIWELRDGNISDLYAPFSEFGVKFDGSLHSNARRRIRHTKN